MNRIIHGDNLIVLPTLEADSINAGVTDPPYGIGFMGKEWDCFKPEAMLARDKGSWDAESARQRHINPNLRGRSRSPALSPSQIEYDGSVGGLRRFQAWSEQWAREVYRVLKPGAHLLVCGAPRSFHRMTCGLEDAGFEIRDCIMWIFGQGFPKSHNIDPFSRIETRQTFDGWGTALKPSWEPIIMARKPLAGTVAANVQAHGTGALNIDGCRIATPETLQGSTVRNDIRGGKYAAGHRANPGDIPDFQQSSLGRWPANLIHDGSEEVVSQFPNVESGQPAGIKAGGKLNCFGTFAGGIPVTGYGDAGSAARFFYCAKTSRTDRNEGCEHMERKPLNWSSGTQSPGTFQAEGTDKTSPNNHPTVKPTALMRYLVRMVTPPGGTVLDPFNGSGSTGKACIYEGMNYIGIEKEAEYVAISEARWAHAEQDHRDNTAQQELALV